MSLKTYAEFIQSKTVSHSHFGLTPNEPHEILFRFQRDIVKWAIRKGRACIFADCGMGKTFIQLEWARQIPGNVLILAPLAVTSQTEREARKLGTEANYCRSMDEVRDGITITNYEMLDHFEVSQFAGVVLDESSIIKHFDSKTRRQVIERFSGTHYRLACTATPAPNDHMELGNHAEFVGAMSRSEMLSMFFVHDGGDTSKWRLKRHAAQDFWQWVCSWAVMIRKPSDLGYDDGGFVLPPINLQQVKVRTKIAEAITLSDRIKARRGTVSSRARRCAAMVNELPNEAWIVWCNLNSEADEVTRLIPDAVQITGSESVRDKAKKLYAFSEQWIRVLVTKPGIAGFGMNWQHCANVAFVGLSDSWESYYQAVRRCWRFGQKRTVNVHIITSTAEGRVVANIQRKESDAARMAKEMVKHMHVINEAEIRMTTKREDIYLEDVARGDRYELHLGDCVELARRMPDDSVGYSIFSPPFASLYTYSATGRDMGNCQGDEQFEEHFAFLVKELYRILMPGRLVSFHCMNLPTSKERDGIIGIRDFRGQMIRVFQREGFIFHSEVCIWKNPVTAMQRTKALGLLHKQLVKDSCMSRQGIPDYLVTMRKAGVNFSPVSGRLNRWIGDQSHSTNGNGTAKESIELWQRYASPVWMDINASRTLQRTSAREEEDERHICPLQLDVIERALELWSNHDDVVYSPFAGIGSEGWIAIQTGRRFIGHELKGQYWKQAVANLVEAEREINRKCGSNENEAAFQAWLKSKKRRQTEGTTI
jgi:DNA modification methylase